MLPNCLLSHRLSLCLSLRIHRCNLLYHFRLVRMFAAEVVSCINGVLWLSATRSGELLPLPLLRLYMLLCSMEDSQRSLSAEPTIVETDSTLCRSTTSASSASLSSLFKQNGSCSSLRSISGSGIVSTMILGPFVAVVDCCFRTHVIVFVSGIGMVVVVGGELGDFSVLLLQISFSLCST